MADTRTLQSYIYIYMYMHYLVQKEINVLETKVQSSVTTMHVVTGTHVHVCTYRYFKKYNNNTNSQQTYKPLPMLSHRDSLAW